MEPHLRSSGPVQVIFDEKERIEGRPFRKSERQGIQNGGAPSRLLRVYARRESDNRFILNQRNIQMLYALMIDE